MGCRNYRGNPTNILLLHRRPRQIHILAEVRIQTPHRVGLSRLRKSARTTRIAPRPHRPGMELQSLYLLRSTRSNILCNNRNRTHPLAKTPRQSNPPRHPNPHSPRNNSLVDPPQHPLNPKNVRTHVPNPKCTDARSVRPFDPPMQHPERQQSRGHRSAM